jgi:hypothetical protein
MTTERSSEHDPFLAISGSMISLNHTQSHGRDLPARTSVAQVAVPKLAPRFLNNRVPTYVVFCLQCGPQTAIGGGGADRSIENEARFDRW